MTQIRLFGFVLLGTAFLAVGCGTKVRPVANASPSLPAIEAASPPPRPGAPSDRVARPSAALSDEDIFARKTLAELNAERPLTDVFFVLDNWVIGDEGRAILQKNAQWLLRWTSTRITIEGHCDDRGTSEYNLALGERRANAVREYLGSLGVTPDRVLVISKGEESPVCSETDESCWQQNRRGHPIISAK
jgi:peptidoglycan-associated lipoprotein